MHITTQICTLAGARPTSVQDVLISGAPGAQAQGKGASPAKGGNAHTLTVKEVCKPRLVVHFAQHVCMHVHPNWVFCTALHSTASTSF